MGRFSLPMGVVALIYHEGHLRAVKLSPGPYIRIGLWFTYDIRTKYIRKPDAPTFARC